MVIELPNLGSNFPNLPPLQPIPIVQYLSMSQERKERLKGFPNPPEHPTRQDKEPLQGQIQLSLLVQQPLTQPTAHTTPQGPFILHKLARTRHKCAAQNTHNKRSQLPRRTLRICSQRKVWRIRAHAAAGDFTPFQILLCRTHHLLSKKWKHHTPR